MLSPVVPSPVSFFLAGDVPRPAKGRLHLTVLPQAWHEQGRPLDCEAEGPRCCLVTDCRFHLGPASWDRSQSCAIDVADDGPQSLRAVAEHEGVSFQMVDKIERRALQKFREGMVKLRAGLTHGGD